MLQQEQSDGTRGGTMLQAAVFLSPAPFHLDFFHQVANRCLLGLPNMNTASPSLLESCPWSCSISSQISS